MADSPNSFMNILGGIAGAVVPGLGSIIQGNINRQTSLQNTELTYQKNKQLADYQYGQQLDMWNKANAYNSPTQQMQRLKSAGLNPNLVYGNGAVGNMASNIPQYQSPRVQYEAPPAVNIPEVLSAYQDFRLKQAQLDNMQAHTRQAQQATANAVEMGKLLGEDLPYRTYRAQNEQLKWSRQSAIQERTLNQEISNKLLKYQLAEELAPYQLDLGKVRVDALRTSIDKMNQDIARSKVGIQRDRVSMGLMNAQRMRTNAERQLTEGRFSLIPQQARNMQAQVALMKVQEQFKQKELDWYVTKFWTDTILRGIGTAGNVIKDVKGVKGSPGGMKQNMGMPVRQPGESEGSFISRMNAWRAGK